MESRGPRRGRVVAAVMAPLLTNVGSATAYVEATSMVSLEALAERSDLRPIEGGKAHDRSVSNDKYAAARTDL